MTATKKTATQAKRPSHRAKAVLTATSRRQAVTSAKTVSGQAPRVSVEVEPLVDIVRRHVHLTPSLAKAIKGDFMRAFQDPALGTAPAPSEPAVTNDDLVLSTQDAADLVGVSRPYIVARIDAGDIPLHQQVGNQRRVLRSAVLAWHRREQLRRRRALGKLGADLDGEIFAG